jgi:hypothetical protein
MSALIQVRLRERHRRAEGTSATNALERQKPLSLLYWGGGCQASSDFSVGPVSLSVAGSALLFWIGTEALP